MNCLLGLSHTLSIPKSILKIVLTLCIFIHVLVHPYCFQLYHRALTLTQDEVSTALSHTNLEQMWLRDLRPLLVTRYPGSAGSQAVQEVSHFSF